MPRILVVEDDPAIAETIATALAREGWQTVPAGLLAQARTLLAGSDAVVLDIGLPDGSGLDFCRELRTTSSVPVLFLSSRADEIDRVVGLEIGADDYLAKPFSPRELVARLRALMRRSSAPSVTTVTGFLVDAAAQRIRWRGRVLDLTRQEYRLLATLLAQPGVVLSRARLLDLAWDDPSGPFDRAVDAAVRDLRAKLRLVDAAADPIRTVRGEGYAVEDV